MVMRAWLYTVLEEQDSLQEGQPWRFWTAPQRATAVSYDDAGLPRRQVRRRGDGKPYTPRWQAGESMLIYHPDGERVIALLTLDSAAKWDEAEQPFWTESTVELYAPDDGPALADIGVDQAVQGGRQRLTPAQHGAAVKALRGSLSRKFSQTVEAAAARNRPVAQVLARARERVSIPRPSPSGVRAGRQQPPDEVGARLRAGGAAYAVSSS